LELPVRKIGICFGIDGKPLETLELPVGKMVYVLELVENHWKCWKCQLEILESVLEYIENQLVLELLENSW